ncbi:MAG TPA: fibronectin type III domain-containing protein [Candidatus Thermoplasmatota archaeon]|nr:fibronectin type III domain-containing protein [Candidatus Thermoplasmatota archaeon]
MRPAPRPALRQATVVLLVAAFVAGGLPVAAQAPAPALPGAPLDLAAKRGPGEGVVTLGWSAPADGGDSVTHYRIYRLAGDASATLVGTSATPTFAHAGLSPGSSHTYRVSAVNASGEGPMSDPVTGHTWPALSDALVRPGVQIWTEGKGWCTTNFVFHSPVTRKLYIGTAGHCVDHAIGANVHLPSALMYHTSRVDGNRGPVFGKVAYSSFLHENVSTAPCFSVLGTPVPGLSCAVGNGNRANDFALVEILPAWEGLVHPAVLHFGGPTAVVHPLDVPVLTEVVSYGNSPLRAGLEPTSPKRGFVTGRTADSWTVQIYTVSPGVPGDSGSNLLLADGRALGIVVTLAFAPLAGSNGVTSLARALEYAEGRTGWQIELQTWDRLV